MAKLKENCGSFKEGQGSYLWGNISLPKLGTFMVDKTKKLNNSSDTSRA